MLWIQYISLLILLAAIPAATPATPAAESLNDYQIKKFVPEIKKNYTVEPFNPLIK